MLLAAIPRAAGPDGPRILREVWPLTLTERESEVPRKGSGISASRALAALEGEA